MRRRVAIVGAGITLFRRRMLESPKELSFEASKMALDSAGLTLKDIQSVVSGSAPDAFDGVHMKGEYYLDGMGAIGKPHERVYVGGGTGVFTPIGGWWNVASERPCSGYSLWKCGGTCTSMESKKKRLLK